MSYKDKSAEFKKCTDIINECYKNIKTAQNICDKCYISIKRYDEKNNLLLIKIVDIFESNINDKESIKKAAQEAEENISYIIRECEIYNKNKILIQDSRKKLFKEIAYAEKYVDNDFKEEYDEAINILTIITNNVDNIILYNIEEILIKCKNTIIEINEYKSF